LFEIGDGYAFPTSGGGSINPYFASLEQTPSWRHDGWAVMVIIARGRAFDFLAWYQFLTIDCAAPEKPTAIPMDDSQLWVLRQPGTVTPLHIKRLQLERLGSVSVDSDKLQKTFPYMRPGIVQAVIDLSICDGMKVGPKIPARFIAPPGETAGPRTRFPTILGLGTILAG